MRKLITAGLALLAGVGCYAGTLSYTTAEVDQFLTRVDHLGWAVYFDDQYTEGSPLVIDDTRTNLMINGQGAATITTYLPNAVTILWDTNNNEIVSSAIGNAYNVRVQFKAKAAVGATFFDIEFDIGNGAGPVIASRTLGAPKASGVEIQYSVGLPIYSMETFVANGCGVYLDSTPDSATISVYDLQIHIQQIFHEGL
jgi:hypothetical protein